MSLKLEISSTNLWMEYVGFYSIVAHDMLQTMIAPTSAIVIENWLQTRFQYLDNRAKNEVNYHSFFNKPPIKWLTYFTPLLNQSVLMATAVPPVVMDMSTVDTTPSREQPQWAVFTQFDERVNVTMKRLPKSHNPLHL